jgi:hypothetical protein
MLGKHKTGKYKRYAGKSKMCGHVPSGKDAYTTYLIWESFKKFILPGYFLVRVKQHNMFRGGFRVFKGKAVLLYSSYQEGEVAAKTWLWFANTQLGLKKE